MTLIVALFKNCFKLKGNIDVIIPRGGKSLIQTISENSRVPTLKHLEGICHTDLG